MKNRRMFPVLAAAALMACGEDEPDKRIDDPRPVDGPYYVSVLNDFSDDCYVIMIPADGPVYTLDVLRRGDGNLNLIGNAMIAGPAVIENVVHDRGNIRHAVTYKPAYWSGDGEPPEYKLKVEGTLTPDAVDLKIVSTEGGCVATSEISGPARPLSDPAAFDGRYALTAGDLGSVCPGTEPPEPYEWNIVSDLTDTGVSGNVMIELDGMYIVFPRPGADGRVEWTGNFVWYYDPESYFVLDATGTLTGTLLPERTDLLLEYDLVDYPGDCPWFMTFKGGKRLPSLQRIDNDYRLHVEVRTTCPEEGEDAEWTLERTATIVTQEDGRLLLEDFTGQYLLEAADGIFAAGYGYPGYFTIDLSGAVAPPTLNYGYVIKEYDDAGSVKCELDADITGAVRYVFPE